MCMEGSSSYFCAEEFWHVASLAQWSGIQTCKWRIAGSTPSVATDQRWVIRKSCLHAFSLSYRRRTLNSEVSWHRGEYSEHWCISSNPASTGLVNLAQWADHLLSWPLLSWEIPAKWVCPWLQCIKGTTLSQRTNYVNTIRLHRRLKSFV